MKGMLKGNQKTRNMSTALSEKINLCKSFFYVKCCLDKIMLTVQRLMHTTNSFKKV